MQFSCESTQLAKGVNTVRKAISSSPNAPLFSGIHMILQGNELKLVAMDINFSMEKTMEVNGQEDGSILVPAQYICDLLARFNNHRPVTTTFPRWTTGIILPCLPSRKKGS